MKKVLVIVLFVILGGASLAYLAYDWLLNDNVSAEDSISFYVQPETSVEQLTEDLTPYLMDAESFANIASAKGLEKPKPGHYIITPRMSNNDLVNTFRAGLQKPVRITFTSANYPEEVAKKLADQVMISESEIWEQMQSLWGEDVIYHLIPNTYEVYWTLSAEDLCERLERESKRFWNEKRLAQAESIGLTSEQVVVLASIVEKETAKRDEYNTVAGLYLNRLNKGWRLQSDPTVIYAKKLAEGRDIEIRRVLYADLKIDSPYNTYQNYGLPPSPIMVPDTEVINAVLRGSKHRYMYMCANPDNPGYHAFAETDAQHNANKQRYVKWLNRNKIYR
ncbi:MAG: endolytic transglycosylase MltG [Schleiferiaceae bacterium]